MDEPGVIALLLLLAAILTGAAFLILPGMLIGGAVRTSRKRILFGLAAGGAGLAIYGLSGPFPILAGHLSWALPVLCGIALVAVSPRWWIGVPLAVLGVVPVTLAMLQVGSDAKAAANAIVLRENSPWLSRDVPVRLGEHDFRFPLASAQVGINVHSQPSEGDTSFLSGSEAEARRFWRLSDEGRDRVALDSLTLLPGSKYCRVDRRYHKRERPGPTDLCRGAVSAPDVWCGMCGPRMEPDSDPSAFTYIVRPIESRWQTPSLRSAHLVDVERGAGLDWLLQSGATLQRSPDASGAVPEKIWRSFVMTLPGGHLTGQAGGDAGIIELGCIRVGTELPHTVSCGPSEYPIVGGLLFQPLYRIRLEPDDGLDPLQGLIAEVIDRLEGILDANPPVASDG